MKRFTPPIVILVCLMVQANAAGYRSRPESGLPFIHNYSAVEYGESPQNWAAVQDHRGVMYFGNTRGVLEFDGTSWRLVSLPNRSAVRSLAVDQNSRIYVGAQNEIGYLAAGPAGRLVYRSLMPQVTERERNFNDVWKTLIASRGVFFLSRTKILRWTDGEMKVVPFQLFPYFGFVIRDELFLISADQGICVMNGDRPVPLPETGMLKRAVVHNILLLPYGEDKMLVATASGRFFVYHLDRLSRPGPDLLLTRFFTTISRYIHYETNFLYSGKRVNPGEYAFSTLHGGIVMMNGRGELTGIIDRRRGLCHNNVRDLYADREGNLWAATDNGISCVEAGSPVSVFNERNGMEDKCLITVRFGNDLYAGTMRGIFRLSTRQSPPDPGEPAFIRMEGVTLACWDFLIENNRLFAACENGFFEVRGGKARGCRNNNVIGTVFSLGRSTKFPGLIFMGLQEGFAALAVKGISPGDERELKAEYYGRFSDIPETITGITSDGRGDLWLTTNVKGLIHVKFFGEKLGDRLVYRYGTKHGLPQPDANRAFYFHGRLFVATQQGIYRLLQPEDSGLEDSRFVPDPGFCRLVAEKFTALQLVHDRHGRIWINSYNDLGIGFIDGRALSAAEGNPVPAGGSANVAWKSIPFKQIPKRCQHIYIEPDDTIWFATTSGLYRFDPAGQKDYRQPFNTLIRKTLSGQDQVIYYGNGCPAAPSELPYKKNSLIFEFAAPFYASRAANRFQYFLEGFDPDWSNWTRKTDKEYTNLPEGSYAFHVRGMNLFEQAGEEAVYSFVVLPPWHRSTAAYAVYTLLALAVILLGLRFYRYRIKQVILTEQKKYELEPELAVEYMNKLLRLMEAEKPHLNPNLTIAVLARKTGLPYYQLSMIINNQLNKNFFDFVNQYRIEEARRLLSEPSKITGTILQIAYDTGFNSKSSFNKAFKKYTGMTPTEFRRKG